jgi:chemotaxis protein methyltransferase CheR
MGSDSTQELEIRLLLEALRHRCGFDIRHYAQASLRRRLLYCLTSCGIDKISEAIPRIIHDQKFFNELLYSLSVTFTEFFRDPLFFRIIRDRIISILKTYPFVNIWHAGCATGEEVYSMAIMLEEEGLMGKVRIYATDFNNDSLQKAAEAMYRTEDLVASEANYKKAGGKGSLSDYYHIENGSARIDPSLMKNIVFSSLNLATDGVFTEVHLVLCRNVLIYFDNTLQNRVLNLLHDSLVHGGVLCLGSRETLRFSDVENHFLPISDKWRIFQKRVTQTRVLSNMDRRDRVDRRESNDRRSARSDGEIIIKPKKSFKVVVIGCSAGGMVALRMVLSKLPKNLPVPLVVVQHLAMDADAEYLATYLDNHSLLSVMEATDKEKMQPGCVYIAPPGFHLMVEVTGSLSLSNDPKYNYSRPAIDILFESASMAYRNEVVGVLLTGANSDGTKGLKKIVDKGGVTIVQDPSTAESSLMPQSAIEAGVAGRVLPLSGIALEICLMLGCELP